MVKDGGGGTEHCANCGGRRWRRNAHWAEDGGRALCGATEDGCAAAEQVAVHLRSPDLHPSIPACTQIPMLMTRRVSVTISRVSANI